MIATVISKDGQTLYCKVKANPVTFPSTQAQLAKVAITRTRAQLLQDDYFPTKEQAANSGAYFGRPEPLPA